jgi:predicted permease
MIISVILGLCIWFVIPILFEGQIKKKNNRKALKMFCRILGVVIIAWSVFNFILNSV